MAVARTVREVVGVARDRELPFMAAAIAHYVLASLVPLLLLGLALGALVGSDVAIESIVRTRLGGVLSESGQRVVVGALTSLEGAVSAGILSVLFALWSGSKVFRGLSVAFAEVYDEQTSPSLPEQLRDAIVVVGLLALVVAAMIATGVVVSAVPLPTGHPTAVGTAALLVTLVAGLLPIYYVLTPTGPSIRDVLPGTVLAAAGLVSLQVGFVYYARYANRYEALGVLGALLLFVTWLYFGSVVVLLGGALNHVTSRTRG